MSQAPQPAQPSFKPLLPNEPRVLDGPGQQALTERFLLPATAQLEALFLGLRASLDGALCAAQPTKLSKPYPLGQCLEISLAVKTQLKRLNPATLVGPPAQGHAALSAFLRHGGQMNQVWGDLRGAYFQNAFLAGTLYIDVSNDTVVPTKPPVEILPFEQARFTAVADFVHFARVAERYWQARIYPNHVLPTLAPYCPLVAVLPDGCVRVEADSGYMFALTQAEHFWPSQAVLNAPPLSEPLFRHIALSLAGSAQQIASDPAQGKALALASCEACRAQAQQPWPEQRTVVGRAVQEVNRLPARRVFPTT